MTGASRSNWVERWVAFAWWQVLNARVAAWPTKRLWGAFAGMAAVGAFLRIWASSAPWNYDFTVWVDVADAWLSGTNPYTLGKHLYGPPWLLIYTALRAVFNDVEVFRLAVATVLTIVDVAIAGILVQRRYPVAAVLFLIAPISIAITGQHTQFDNMAVLWALAAACLVPRDTLRVVTGRDWAAVALLGLSISTKHVFLVFPLWLAVRQRNWVRGLFYLLIPLAIFALSFLPFWLWDSESIRYWVLNYRSQSNAPLYYLLLPHETAWGLVNRGFITWVFLGCMALLAFAYKRLPVFESALVYTVTMVLFSSAVVDQYLSIASSGAAVFLNIGFVLWLGFVGIYVLGEPQDLNLPVFNTLKLHVAPQAEIAYKDQVVYLLAGWIIMNAWLWREGLLNGKDATAEERRETV